MDRDVLEVYLYSRLSAADDNLKTGVPDRKARGFAASGCRIIAHRSMDRPHESGHAMPAAGFRDREDLAFRRESLLVGSATAAVDSW